MAADVLPLSSGDDEALRAIRVAAEDLANLPEIERSYYLPRRAEEIGVPPKDLKSAVTAVLRERAKRVAAEQLERDREQKRRDDEEKRQKQERQRLADEAERAARKAEHAALKKAKAKAQGLGNIARLPVAWHERELQRLAGSASRLRFCARNLRSSSALAAVRYQLKKPCLGLIR